METHVCTRCSKALAESEFRPLSRGGRRSCCRACERAYNHSYNTSGRHRTAQRRYFATSKGKRAKQRGNRKFTRRHPHSYFAGYYAKYRSTLKGKETAIRRSVKRRAVGPLRVELSWEEWAAILSAHGGRCAYCGRRLTKPTRDHVIPISRGGHHTADNIVPACRWCNTSKGDRTGEEYRSFLKNRRPRKKSR
jgi:5-methylcytosine-specific restriction endonuclease McrA